MFRAWSVALRRTEVRGLLLIVGVFATLAFAPMAAIGVQLVFAMLQSSAPDRFQSIGWGIAGAGGMTGILGAWVRLLLSPERFSAHPVLKWLTVTALALGVVAAGITFAGVLSRPANLLAWLMAPPLIIGVFLLGATLGEGRAGGTVERDGPSPRPSP